MNPILLCLLVPLMGALGITAARHKPNLREGITLSTALVLFFCVLQLLNPAVAEMAEDLPLLDAVGLAAALADADAVLSL